MNMYSIERIIAQQKRKINTLTEKIEKYKASCNQVLLLHAVKLEEIREDEQVILEGLNLLWVVCESPLETEV